MIFQYKKNLFVAFGFSVELSTLSEGREGGNCVYQIISIISKTKIEGIPSPDTLDMKRQRWLVMHRLRITCVQNDNFMYFIFNLFHPLIFMILCDVFYFWHVRYLTVE